MTAPAYTPVESLVAGWVRTALAGSVRCVTEIPANLETVLPLARFQRVAGVDNFGLDDANVDVDYFDVGRDNTRGGALVLLSKLRWDMPGALLGSGVVTKVETVMSPIATPWDNTNLRRFTFTVRVMVHSR